MYAGRLFQMRGLAMYKFKIFTEIIPQTPRLKKREGWREEGVGREGGKVKFIPPPGNSGSATART